MTPHERSKPAPAYHCTQCGKLATTMRPQRARSVLRQQGRCPACGERHAVLFGDLHEIPAMRHPANRRRAA